MRTDYEGIEGMIESDEIEKLQEQNALLHRAFEEVEWIYDDRRGMICAWCDGRSRDGHKPNCLRQKALGLDKKESEE